MKGSVNNKILIKGENNFTMLNAMRQAYLELYNALSGTGNSLGIMLRASNYAGGGLGYPGSGNSLPGDNSWSVFEFTNASPKFWVKIQMSNVNTFTGSAYDNPNVKQGGVAIAVVMRQDGNSPWNGTTASNGSDTQGTPVWIAGTSRLAMFPINNNDRTEFSTKRDSMAPVISAYNIPDGYDNSEYATNIARCNFHILLEQDSITTIFQRLSNHSMVFHFGKIISNSNNASPYICFSLKKTSDYRGSNDAVTGGHDFYPLRANYSGPLGSYMPGSIVPGTNNASQLPIYNGGIIDPITFKSTRALLSINGALERNRALSYLNTDSIRSHISKHVSANSFCGKINLFPIYVYADGYEMRGLLGYVKNIFTSVGFTTNTTFNNREFATFNISHLLNNHKCLVVRWGAPVSPNDSRKVDF